ncbi:head GIN domain-containing protein [Nemorincola caseinilytica]|uniref:Head GIN domain-containing protein n=1 Tax=Nemorincola caseinilytica TaxID=2054315 RepID=A0ABP8N7S2_9BACT
MKKTLLVALAAVSVVSFQSCRRTVGEGPSITKTYNVSGFTSIDAGLDGDVYYTQDSVYKVEIYAQSNVQDLIETPIVDGELRLQFKKFSSLRRHGKVVVYISAPSINGLGVNGSGNVYASQPISSASMALKVNGSGNLSINSYTGTSVSGHISGSGRITVTGGSVRSSELRTSGSGDIDMLGLQAENVTVHTSGSGTTTVSASNSLDVRISGSGDVYYRGNPSVYTSISGSGKVSRI